jgi:hypothetical protein
VQDLQTLAQFLNASKLFGTDNIAQSVAIVTMCQQERISWMKFMQTFHMMNGVLTKKADAMLADLHRIGGTHKPICRTAEKAECYFKNGESEYTSTVNWADCLNEPFVYVGKDKDVIVAIANGHKWPNGQPLQLKSKYATPRSRMQMLWARCVSDGVRVVAPECVQGIYTPEEASDFIEVPCAPASPTKGIATPAPAARPSVREAQGVASPSPLAADPAVCPCGPLMGKPWAVMETKMLQLALSTPNPEITTEMQDHIRAILVEREKMGKAADDCAQAAINAEERKANNIGSDIND